jgi:hypothetical protein
LGAGQLKQAAGQLVGAVPFGAPGIAVRLLAMPADDLAQILSALRVPAEEADRLKRGGFYVDIGRDGQLHEPAEVTWAEVTRQLARARLAADSVRILLEPDEQARLAHPRAAAIELLRAEVSALTESGYARTPDAAADVLTKMVGKLRERMTGRCRQRTLAA